MEIINTISESTGHCPECGKYGAIFTDNTNGEDTVVDCHYCGYLGPDVKTFIDLEDIPEQNLSIEDW